MEITQALAFSPSLRNRTVCRLSALRLSAHHPQLLICISQCVHGHTHHIHTHTTYTHTHTHTHTHVHPEEAFWWDPPKKWVAGQRQPSSLSIQIVTDIIWITGVYLHGLWEHKQDYEVLDQCFYLFLAAFLLLPWRRSPSFPGEKVSMRGKWLIKMVWWIRSWTRTANAASEFLICFFT